MEAKNIATFATSFLFPNLCRGIYLFISFSLSPPFNYSKPRVFDIAPGAMPFTLTPKGPNSTAKCLVNASTPAYAAPAWICSARPLKCIKAEILIIVLFMLRSLI